MTNISWKKLKAITKSLQNGAAIGAACEAAKINRITLWRWRKQDPRNNEFVIRLLDNQIEVVEDALFKRAIGYRYEEETKEKEVGTSERRIVKIVIKEVVPDTTAQIFFLMNKAPDRWADKRALIQNTNIIKNIVNPISKLSDEELDGIITGVTQKR